MRKSLTKSERLKKKTDLDRVFSSKWKVSVPGLKLCVDENGLNRNRIAVTLPRKYGNSVRRNRAKRIIREIYRNSKPLLKSGYDLIIIVYPVNEFYPGNDSYKAREHHLMSLFRKAGIVAGNCHEIS